MQTLYYCMVLTAPSSPYANIPVVPALMYCAKNYGNNYSGIVKLTSPDVDKKKEIEDFKQEYEEEYRSLLEQ